MLRPMRTSVTVFCLAIALASPMRAQDEAAAKVQTPDKEARKLVRDFKKSLKTHKKNLKGRIEAVEVLGDYSNNLLVKPLLTLAQKDKSKTVRMAAAKAWSLWEGRTATLQPRKSVVDHFSDSFTAFSLARIEAHYFINNVFLQEDQIINDIEKIKDIPGTIVQGRYDLICPLESAWELHQAWHASDLYIIGDAGHSATEVGIVNALIKATRNMLKRVK